MGGRQVSAARRLLAEVLDGPLSEAERVAAARSVVVRLGSAERLSELVAELAAGEGDPAGNARLSYRHVLGFDKLLLLRDGSRHMLRAHVWHPGAGGAGAEDIHNHRCALASYVVRGRLAMELYAHEPGEADGPGRAREPGEAQEPGEAHAPRGGGIPAARYQESLAPGRTADWRLEPVGPARLRLAHAGRYAAGSDYALPAHTLHRAWCDTDAPTVTLFLETGGERRRHTDVFTAAGPRPRTVPKVPLGVPEYLAALGSLAELLRDA
ncbi:hypothetical protein [Streptomyces mexicanus]|uniref:Cysteine dioxygenase n=1 Tax=Streptomyces mexicanus TaxID=178566 RepID=A0A7X1I6M8_9ACTN|nr:hypothetical protein [Streptomyces mexicanus]MBC2869762.1 hypothetical protein [Streptomyces mexicanus]